MRRRARALKFRTKSRLDHEQHLAPSTFNYKMHANVLFSGTSSEVSILPTREPWLWHNRIFYSQFFCIQGQADTRSPQRAFSLLRRTSTFPSTATSTPRTFSSSRLV